MITFIIAIIGLLIGYFFYGSLIEKNFKPDSRVTPAIRINDEVDYIPLPTWKVFLIQLLNIAGTGPIFGALSGAIFGPIVYLWIVFGCIFAGAVHDYNCGMLSTRHDGASISELVGIYLGKNMKRVMVIFSIILLVMCGVVFTIGPAGLLSMLFGGKVSIWLWVILVYYFVATFLPIDKIIGRLYPLFGVCLILMALGVSLNLIIKPEFVMPELWNNFKNLHASNTPVWPFMFITVACGAISGFHATQSPMMARCLKSEYEGRKVFYGAMIAEGIIALIWAAAGVTCYENSLALLEAGGGCSAVVYYICQTTMGKVGGVLALIGVVICPISSGDTAYRSARLTLADSLKLDQANMKNRLLLTLPLLISGAIICKLDYSIIWRYFSWSNQTLAMIALWTISIYLSKEGKNYKFTFIPALFMSSVSITYFVVAPECLGILWNALGISFSTYYLIGIIVGIFGALVLGYLFLNNKIKDKSI